MIDAWIAALAFSFSWPNFLYIIAGTYMGQCFGIFPGLSGSIALALLVPFTFGWDMKPALLLLGSAMGGATFGGSITGILVNIPGNPSNAATCLDGYPLAQQGKAGIAIGASATASACGAIFGLLILIAVIPIMREVVLAFGPPEVFFLAILGLSIISVVSEGPILNGLISGAFGIILSFIGFNPVTGSIRYTFGSDYLWNGIPLVPALIGLFAIAQVLTLSSDESKTISRLGEISGSVREGAQAVFKNWWLLLRSSALGTLIGSIPGVGGAVAAFLAYGQAVQTCKDPENFGKGDIRGVIAPEAANDAKDGGSLMPMLALGIPGSANTAVLVGAFILHGIVPGRTLFTDHLNLVFILITALICSNVLTSVSGMLTGKWIAKVITAPTVVLAAVVFIIACVGAFSTRYLFEDVILSMCFGFIGFYMNRYKFSRIALIIGLVLGAIAEKTFTQSLQISRGSYLIFITRPISLVLIILLMVVLIVPYIKVIRRLKSQ